MKIVLLVGVFVFSSALLSTKFEGQNRVTSLPADSDRWALLVGIGKYDDAGLSTLYGQNDVSDLASDLQKYAQFPSDQIIVLSDDATDSQKKPTKQNILLWLSIIKTRSSISSLLLFAFSGHGFSVDNQTFLFAQETRLRFDVDYLKGAAIGSEEIATALKHSIAKQVILLIDSCRDQAVVSKGEGAPKPLTDAFADSFDLAKLNSNKEAYLVFYATGIGQEAFLNDTAKRSYFSLALHQAFQGESFEGKKPYNEDGEMTLGSLVDYVTARTPKSVKADHPERAQYPWERKEGYLSNQVVLAKRSDLRLVKKSNEPIRAITPNKDADLLSQAFLLQNINPIKALGLFVKESTAAAKTAYGQNKWLTDLWSLIWAARLREMPTKLSADGVTRLSGQIITGDGRYLIGCRHEGAPAVEFLSLDGGSEGKTSDAHFLIREIDFTSCLVSESEGSSFVTVNVKVKASDEPQRSYLFDLTNKTPRLSESLEDSFSVFDGKTLITTNKRKVTWNESANLSQVTKSAELPKSVSAVLLGSMPFSRYRANILPSPFLQLGPHVEARCLETCQVYISNIQDSREISQQEMTRTESNGVSVHSQGGQVLDSARFSDIPIVSRQLSTGDTAIVTSGGKVFRWSRTFLHNCCEIGHGTLKSINSLGVGSKSTFAIEGTSENAKTKVVLFQDKAEKGSQEVPFENQLGQKLWISPTGNWLIGDLGDHRIALFSATRLGAVKPIEVRCDPPIETDPNDEILACVDPDSGKVMIRKINDLQKGTLSALALYPNKLSLMGGRLYSLTVHSDSKVVLVSRADKYGTNVEGSCSATVENVSQGTADFISGEQLVLASLPGQIEILSAIDCKLKKTLTVPYLGSPVSTNAVGTKIFWKVYVLGDQPSQMASLSILDLIDPVDHSSPLPLTFYHLPPFDQVSISGDSKSAIIISQNHVYQIPITESGLLNLAREVLMQNQHRGQF